jgi:hypothetical protein
VYEGQQLVTVKEHMLWDLEQLKTALREYNEDKDLIASITDKYSPERNAARQRCEGADFNFEIDAWGMATVLVEVYDVLNKPRTMSQYVNEAALLRSVVEEIQAILLPAYEAQHTRAADSE